MDRGPGFVPTSIITHTSGSRWRPSALNTQRWLLIFFELCCFRQRIICTGTMFCVWSAVGCTSCSDGSTHSCVVYSNRCATVSRSSTWRFMIPSWYTPTVASRSSTSLSHGSIPSNTRLTTIRCHAGCPSSSHLLQYLDQRFRQMSRMFCITPCSVRAMSTRSSL